MKAVDFIKKFGWEKAKLYANGWITFDDGVVENNVSRESVKQYVDAYELVQSYGSLVNAKYELDDPEIDASDAWNLKQAVTLVKEVCGG